MLNNRMVEFIRDHSFLLWLVCTLGMPMALIAAVGLITSVVVVPIYFLMSLF